MGQYFCLSVCWGPRNNKSIVGLSKWAKTTRIYTKATKALCIRKNYDSCLLGTKQEVMNVIIETQSTGKKDGSTKCNTVVCFQFPIEHYHTTYNDIFFFF